MFTPIVTPELWDGEELLVRASDPDTSRAAATKTRSTLSELQSVVLGIIGSTTVGMTDDELTAYYDEHRAPAQWPAVKTDTPRKRRSDLTRMGRLADSGVRRMNRYGSLEVVWVVA